MFHVSNVLYCLEPEGKCICDGDKGMSLRDCHSHGHQL